MVFIKDSVGNGYTRQTQPWPVDEIHFWRDKYEKIVIKGLLIR